MYINNYPIRGSRFLRNGNSFFLVSQLFLFRNMDYYIQPTVFGIIGRYIRGFPCRDILCPINGKGFSLRAKTAGSLLITSLGYPIRMYVGYICRHSNRLLNGIPAICTDGISQGHRSLHFRTEIGAIGHHIPLGTSVITSKIFCFKRHLFSGKCRYCFLETAP